jgi:hypothetical protein
MREISFLEIRQGRSWNRPAKECRRRFHEIPEADRSGEASISFREIIDDKTAEILAPLRRTEGFR